MDRLGELTWLGPISVLLFGILVGLVVHAASVPGFDRWMLLLTVGTFAGAYPLMYFAQEYVSLEAAVLVSAAVALGIIAVRAATLMRVWLAAAGVVLPAAAIMAVTLVATISPRLQGILLTAEALGFFIVVMMLMPKIRIEWRTGAASRRPSPLVSGSAGRPGGGAEPEPAGGSAPAKADQAGGPNADRDPGRSSDDWPASG